MFSYYEEEYECLECTKTEKRISSAQEFLGAVIDELSSDKPLDLDNLVWQLDELCGYLGMQFPQRNLNVTRI